MKSIVSWSSGVEKASPFWTNRMLCKFSVILFKSLLYFSVSCWITVFSDYSLFSGKEVLISIISNASGSLPSISRHIMLRVYSFSCSALVNFWALARFVPMLLLLSIIKSSSCTWFFVRL